MSRRAGLRLAWLPVLLMTAACSVGRPDRPAGASSTEAAPIPAEVALPNNGPAPELTTEVWLNTDRPLRLRDLRGQVVLIDMWTFG